MIATHGRSFYVLDDITPLRQATPTLSTEDAHLFRPPAAERNVNQARIDYYLSKPSDKIQIDILDGKGQVVRTFNGTPAQAGRGGRAGRGGAAPDAAGGDEFGGGFPPIEGSADEARRRWWTRRARRRQCGSARQGGSQPLYVGHALSGREDFQGLVFWGGNTQGPLAVPGTYQVRLTANGKTLTQQFEVEKDPRLDSVTIADLTEQFTLSMKIRDEVTQSDEIVILIRELKRQMADRLKSSQDAALKASLDQFREKLSAIEEDVYQVRNRSGQDPLNFPIKLNNKIAALGAHVAHGDGKPTASSYEVFELLTQRLNEEQGKLDRTLKADLPGVNKMLTDRKLQELAPTKTETPARQNN